MSQSFNKIFMSVAVFGYKQDDKHGLFFSQSISNQFVWMAHVLTASQPTGTRSRLNGHVSNTLEQFKQLAMPSFKPSGKRCPQKGQRCIVGPHFVSYPIYEAVRNYYQPHKYMHELQAMARTRLRW